MKECWINVYNTGLGIEQIDRWDAIEAAKNRISGGCKLRYRLHVKLKPKPAPKFEKRIYHKATGNWMG